MTNKKNRDRSDKEMKNEKEIIEEIEETKNKVKYGWYLKNVMIILLLIGTSGILMIILSVFLGGLLRLILLPSGIAIGLILLWPGIGLLTMNLITDKNMAHPTVSLPEIMNLKSPKILDIGCGWGTLARHAAKHYKAKATGVTISKEQLAYHKKKCEEDKVEDFRQDIKK